MNLLSTFWNRIQRSLIPDLEEDLGPLTENQRRLVAIRCNRLLAKKYPPSFILRDSFSQCLCRCSVPRPGTAAFHHLTVGSRHCPRAKNWGAILFRTLSNTTAITPGSNVQANSIAVSGWVWKTLLAAGR
jgi:hypothetical protein